MTRTGTGTSVLAQRAFPLNAWYAAAGDAEVGRTITPKRIADRPVVLYRTIDGQPVALADACWHRLVPLSMGTLKGDELQCGYHGIRYDAAGRCTHMPPQETINPSARVTSYPVVERHRFVWLWPGDPALADPGESLRPAPGAPDGDRIVTSAPVESTGTGVRAQ